MDDTEIKIGLSPEDVIASLKKMATETRNLQAVIEDALGKKASAAVNDLKDTTEKGTNEITKFFSNMGTRIKEDLKTAFDVSSVMAGANFAKQIQDGVKQVLDMERAFDRLNIRLGLSAEKMEGFKRSVGRATAGAGMNVKDVQGGLSSAAAHGIKDPGELAQIASVLAQSKQINPDIDTGGVSDNVIEIMKAQGQQLNAGNFKQTMDAINSSVANGAFKNANEASSSIAGMSNMSRQLGLSTRDLAGLAGVASQNQNGEGVLNSLLKSGTGFDQGAKSNALLGANIFKDGKLNASAIGGIDVSSDQRNKINAQALGLGEDNGADLKMFVESFRSGMGNFNAIIKGSNETASQFDTATESFAAKLSLFKARVTNAGQEIGDGIATLASGVMSGDLSKAGRGVGNTLRSLDDNKGDLLAGGALTVGAGLLMGGGVRGLIGGAAASASGTQKVYVTNAGEIAGAGGMGAAGKNGLILAGVATAGLAAAYAVDKVHDSVINSDVQAAGEGQMSKNRVDFNQRNGTHLTPDQFAIAVEKGTLAALKAHGQGAKYTNPSDVNSRGPKAGP